MAGGSGAEIRDHVIPTILNMLAVFFIVLSFVSLGESGGPIAASNIACERNLVSISYVKGRSFCSFSMDTPRPLLSWSSEHDQLGASQTAYRILLFESNSPNEPFWDSGKVFSAETSVEYNGPPLHSFCTYSFTIVWWDHVNVAALDSHPGCFVTGALYNEWTDFGAQWITAKKVSGAPLLRKLVSVEDRVKQATVSIAGLGYYRLFVNDQEITSSTGQESKLVVGLRPGWTQYDLRCPYNTFDISHMLQGAKQLVIGVMLGLGWRNQHDYPNHDHLGKGEDQRVLKALLNLMYESGENETVQTDETWLAYSSPITADAIYAGESYDARREVPHWSSPNYIPKDWSKADIAKGPAGDMDILEMPDMLDMPEEEPKVIYPLPSSQIVDFGDNAAGVCVLEVGSLKNEVVTLHHAEVTLHEPYGRPNGSLYYANLRDAVSIDTYTAGSMPSDMKTYKPSFTYHGFRYVEVNGFPRTLNKSDIKRVRRNTVLKVNPWQFSSTLVNTIQGAIVSGQQSNMMSLPTDCPQRNERLGWMGDAGLSADSMVLNFESSAFHRNYLKLIRDEQNSDGSIPDVVPFVHGGGRPADPSWSAAFVQIVWSLWKYKNDTQTAAEFYPNIVKYLEFMRKLIPSDGFAKYFYRYGDWCPPPPVSRVASSFPSAFSFMANVNQTAELALALGKVDDFKSYAADYEQYKSMFNKAFMTSSHVYADGSQISYALPLALAAVPADEMSAFVKNFTNKIQEDKTHITSGIIGTKYLFPVLSALNYHSLALEIAEQKDYPSYGYMLLNPYEPATSIWELWNGWEGNPGMDSRNHHMFSSISGWFRTAMVGVELVYGSSLLSKVHLWPARITDVLYASTGFAYPHKFEFSWKQYPRNPCFKFPEHPVKHSKLLNSIEPYTISCPQRGAVIVDIVFASFGTPKGSCGHMATGECHATGSEDALRKLCIGKSECVVPVTQEFFGRDCTHYDTRWLYADVQCSYHSESYHDVEVNVTIPMGGSAIVHLPSHGAGSMEVHSYGKLLWRDGIVRGGSHMGIGDFVWEDGADTLAVTLQSGRWQLSTNTAEPDKIVSSYFNGSEAVLECPKGMRVRKILFASFGNPLVKPTTGAESRYPFSVGWCHAHTSRPVVEDLCVGRERCALRLREDFGYLSCLQNIHGGPSLAVVYACSKGLPV